jgi:hypothetical protein
MTVNRDRPNALDCTVGADRPAVQLAAEDVHPEQFLALAVPPWSLAEQPRGGRPGGHSMAVMW